MSRPSSASTPSHVLTLSPQRINSLCPQSRCAWRLPSSPLPPDSQPSAISQAALPNPSEQHRQSLVPSRRVRIREQSP